VFGIFSSRVRHHTLLSKNGEQRMDSTPSRTVRRDDPPKIKTGQVPHRVWEAIEHLRAPNGSKVYSLRLSQKVRAVAYRDGEFLRLISLHPDHYSAYKA
jgi:hypothetical protein